MTPRQSGGGFRGLLAQPRAFSAVPAQRVDGGRARRRGRGAPRITRQGSLAHKNPLPTPDSGYRPAHASPALLSWAVRGLPPVARLGRNTHEANVSAESINSFDLGGGPTARSNQSRAEAEELLLHEVKGAHAVLRASEDECTFGRGEEHPGEVGRL
jgi:hypothetical protein